MNKADALKEITATVAREGRVTSHAVTLMKGIPDRDIIEAVQEGLKEYNKANGN